MKSEKGSDYWLSFGKNTCSYYVQEQNYVFACYQHTFYDFASQSFIKSARCTKNWEQIRCLPV